MSSPDCFDKVSVWICSVIDESAGKNMQMEALIQLTHEIEIYTVVHKIIHSRFDTLRRAEIDPVQFANGFDLFPSPCQADEVWVKFLQICLENRGSIASRIACYKDRQQSRIRRRSGRQPRRDDIKHLRHLVEFFGTNVGAVAKAKIYLSEGTTY